MAGQKYLPEEKAVVRRFLEQLYRQSGAHSWAAFARQAGVSNSSLMAWKYGREMPGAPNMLRLLAAVGLVTQSFELPPETSNGDGSSTR